MSISNFPLALQPIIQQGFLEREFQQALRSRIGYRACADREDFAVGIGETLTKTRAGLKPAVTIPISAAANTNLDNGLTPGSWNVEQFTLTLNHYAATTDLNMVTSRVGIASLFLQNAYVNGEQAARSLDDLARNALFAGLCCKVRRGASGCASGEGERIMSDFKGRHFEGEIVLWAVRWYCRYGVSYRDLEQMMGERGLSVDHSTIYRWVQKYAPEIEKRLRWQWRGPLSTSWRVDETYVKVRGQWAYLYRALDKYGNTIDFYLSPTRNTAAAKRFLGKALNSLKDWEKPTVINTDKAPTYAAALAELKKEGKCPKETVHRQVKYLNNVIEADHGKLKQLIRPVRGFKTLKAAYATIKGFEVMRALRKGQASAFNLTRDIRGEARIVERAFGLGASALAEAVHFLDGRLQLEAA